MLQAVAVPWLFISLLIFVCFSSGEKHGGREREGRWKGEGEGREREE